MEDYCYSGSIRLTSACVESDSELKFSDVNTIALRDWLITEYNHVEREMRHLYYRPRFKKSRFEEMNMCGCLLMKLNGFTMIKSTSFIFHTVVFSMPIFLKLLYTVIYIDDR